MALLGAINNVGREIGDSIGTITSLFQSQVIIQDINKRDDVLLNVTEEENYTMEAEITEKPVADLGSATDYIDRKSNVLTLTGVISNRTINLGADPVEAVVQRAAGLFAPGLVTALNAAASAASLFFDLGKDEIDNKLNKLNEWRMNAIPVRVVGARLDPQKLTPINEQVFMLVQSINPISNNEAGDGVNYTIVLKEFLNLQIAGGSQQGSKITDQIFGSLNLPNPFTSSGVTAVNPF